MATIAAGIINAMHQIVVVARPDTLFQVHTSIQTLIVNAAGNLDSVAVMETIKMILKWHEMRPIVFSWDFLQKTHGMMQERLLRSFRWLHERAPRDLEHLDSLWPLSIGQGSFSSSSSVLKHRSTPTATSKAGAQGLNTIKHLTNLFRDKTQVSIPSLENTRRIMPKTARRSSTKVTSPQMRKGTYTKVLAADAAAALETAQQTQAKTAATAPPYQQEQHTQYLAQQQSPRHRQLPVKQKEAWKNKKTSLQQRVHALEQMIRQLLSEQNVQQHETDSVLADKDSTIRALSKKLKQQERKIMEYESKLLKIKAQQSDLLQVNETLVALMNEYDDAKRKKQYAVINAALDVKVDYPRNINEDMWLEEMDGDDKKSKQMEDEDVWKCTCTSSNKILSSSTKANVYRLLF